MDLLIRKIKNQRACDKPAPIVVHCSAGIGRTGTVIAIYAIIESIDKLHQSLDELERMEIDESILDAYPLFRRVRVSVFGAVRKMREQRWNMVKK